MKLLAALAAAPELRRCRVAWARSQVVLAQVEAVEAAMRDCLAGDMHEAAGFAEARLEALVREYGLERLGYLRAVAALRASKVFRACAHFCAKQGRPLAIFSALAPELVEVFDGGAAVAGRPH